MMCGGFKAESPATAEIQSLVDSFKDQIQNSLGGQFSIFIAKTYTTQVVAGTNYKVKIEVDDSKVVEVKIYEPLPHTGNPKQLSTAAFV